MGVEWVDDDSLARALAAQLDGGQRLCSLLIAPGGLGFDPASRALGEQLSVPAVLRTSGSSDSTSINRRHTQRLRRPMRRAISGRRRHRAVAASAVADRRAATAAAPVRHSTT